MFLTLIRNTLLLLFFIISFSFVSLAQKNSKKALISHEHVSLELISSVNSIHKENNLHLGLYFKLDPGWKIYWKYPGKAGYPPNIDWTKSKNIKDLEILWPKPEKFKILGMESIGYSKEVILPIKLILENNNEELLVNFDVDYLTCKKICIPFNDNLILNIPIGDGEISKYEKIINEYIDKSNYSNYSNFFNPDSILFFLFIAFIGGVVLNFMPCVFPVLSLKIYNVLSQQQENISDKTIKRNFLATILGIIFSFFILSLVIVFLKKIGHNLGWGFQFQSPIFLFFMILILILFSLNLVDVFSIDIPIIFKKFLNRIINLNKKSSEFFQNFFLGSFITILSTPCSAPFIGTAIGFAFVSPNQIIFLIFFCISLGLSSPYIILATKPQILSFLPKPGLWMRKFKYFLSLLLILTAIWLSKTLLIQINTISNDSKNNNWINFDTIKLSELINENNIVFVDITADWCLTCFYNKKTVLDRKKVKNIFETYDVKKIRGDLTKPNREINKYINSFGRFGIPFNAIYSSSAPQGILLPEVLTVQNLLSTFENIKND
jgi:suppressor for copper-sensitivity B